MHIQLEGAPLRPDGQTTMVRRPHRLPGAARELLGSRGRGLVGLARLLVVLGLGCSGFAAASEVEGGTAGLSAAVAGLEEEAENRTLVSQDLAVSRFEDVLFAYMVGEHEAAAEGTWAVRPFLPDGPMRHEADHVLSVSLSAIGATTLAQRINAEILADPGHPFARDAAVRQIELYAEHRTAPEFAMLYEDLRGRGLVEQATGALAYAIGQAHWHLGNLDEAAEAFGGVAVAEPSYDRARYHLGVIAVQRGDLAGATQAFVALREGPETDRSLAELATLALARIAYEEGRYDEAADLYRMFDPESPVRPTALEELAWTELRRDDPPAAALALEERIQLFPEAARPDAQATLGRLYLQFGAAEPAQRAFLAAVATYEKLVKAIPRLHGDPRLPRFLADPDLDLAAADAWTVDELRRDDRVVRAAYVQEVSRLADHGIQETMELVRAVEDRLQADPSTVRDRKLLAEATSRLLDLAEIRLGWAEAQANGTAGRSARPVRDAVQAAATALGLTRATLDRMDALHTQGAVETAFEANATARAVVNEATKVADAKPPDDHDALEGRLRGIIDRVHAQIGARDGPIRERLAAERRDLQAIAVAAQRVGAESDALWTRAGALGSEALLARVDGSLERVRSGLADASWARLVELRDERNALADEHTEALSELQATFDLLRDRGGR